MFTAITKLFDPNEAELKRLGRIVQGINALEETIRAEPDLRTVTEQLRKRLAGGETLDDVLPEAFAAVRESARRGIGQRHYDVQLMGGITLHRGNIAEMKTGEGKTLAATAPLYLNALEGKGAHLVTVNDYLARRDAEWMGPIYRGLGLTVGFIQHDLSWEARRAAYKADITYVTNSEVGFDYLRDNMAIYPDQLVLGDLHYAIVDEVDSILIDESRTPLIISGPAEKATDIYYTMAKLAKKMVVDKDYTVEEKSKSVHLTEEGIVKAESILGVENLFGDSSMDLAHMVQQALRALACYQRDQEYIVQDGQVVIVDEFTGRLMPGRRYGEGLHQAIEAKENVKIERENQTLATITYQNFFRLYKKLAGMTGTAKTEEREFGELYKADVIVIPPNRPMIRHDFSDVVYRTEEGKFRTAVEEIVDCYNRGQPALVGTISIEKSERLGQLLKKRGIPHRILNAKYHAQEAEIVAQAGRSKTVTIATNMAGRGTDIVLGGSPEYLAARLLEEAGIPRFEGVAQSFVRAILQDDLEVARKLMGQVPGLNEELLQKIIQIRDECKADQQKVKELGGLHILGTERHEARRIDNQLRGRSGRQGDLGTSRFYVSLEDDLMRIFYKDWVVAMLDRLGMDDSQPIESGLVTRAIENAQKKVEERNFGIRKQLLEFDNVMNRQREIIYDYRRQVLLNQDVSETAWGMVADAIEAEVALRSDPKLDLEEWDFSALAQGLSELCPAFESYDWEQLRSTPPGQIAEALVAVAEQAYNAREQELGAPLMRELERRVLLEVIDYYWKDHLHTLDGLRQGIFLRGIGQRDPIQEYKFESFKLFDEMIENIKRRVALVIFRARVVPQMAVASQRPAVAPATPQRAAREPAKAASSTTVSGALATSKVGRNDPCPCGSGRKFKHCHGAAVRGAS